MSERLNVRLAKLKEERRAGFVPFIMAGDGSVSVTKSLLNALPENGADIIELGIPFSDPTADGPIIQAAGRRALNAGFKLKQLFDLLRDFRSSDTDTPIILMGYANPVFHYGVDAFMRDASEAGADGLILVDIPAEERSEYQAAARSHGMDIIPLIAPTSLADRLAMNCEGATGFVYYIAIKGITGTASADYTQLEKDVAHIRIATDRPVAVGFGIKSEADVQTVSGMSDLVVVGSAIVERIHKHGEDLQPVLNYCASLAAATKR